MNLFTEKLANWKDWERLFQDTSVFEGLAEHIFRAENLPLAKLERLTPGTNAVFKSGGYVLKIFAPNESGNSQAHTRQSEVFSLKRAEELGVAAPKLVAAGSVLNGSVADGIRFEYIITKHVPGAELTVAAKNMNDGEKYAAGRRLRAMTDLLNTPCKPFNNIDVVFDKDRSATWKDFPESFKAERLEYIASRNFGEKVFTHGDLGGDNIIVAPNGELVIIDFGDAVLAPPCYEHALVAIDMAGLGAPFLRGYFGNRPLKGFAEMCFNGLIIHDFGGDLTDEHIGRPKEFNDLRTLRERLDAWLYE